MQLLTGRKVLTVNTGSSSLKAGLYDLAGGDPGLEFSAIAQSVGEGGRLRSSDLLKGSSREDETALPDHAAALEALFRALDGRPIDAVGHRVVHGGRLGSAPARVTPALLNALRELGSLDPTHSPQAIAAIDAVSKWHPDLPQVACFDTAFHRGMPRVAQIYPLPYQLTDSGILRYGFHGLSYEYVVRQVRAMDPAAGGRMIVAHLGNGASMAAIRDGLGIDTTMGFTPAGGLMMGTRSGDLDPGVLLHLAVDQGMTAVELEELVNRRSGLLGVSGGESDMRELLRASEAGDRRAAEAVELFCYQARKFLGSLAAVLGGLDTLVFTGGIGEHAAPIRRRICQGLGFLGIHLEESFNQESQPVISARGSQVTVRVIPTDEDVMIARHTAALLWEVGDR